MAKVYMVNFFVLGLRNMRTVAFLIFVFYYSLELKAQHQFKGSVYAGLVFSQVDGDQNAGYNKAGYCYGLRINREVNNKWGYSTGLGYIQKGSHSKIDKDDPSKLIFIYRYHYIQIPLYVTFKKNNFTIEAGTSLSYFISGKADLGASVQPITGIRKTDFPLHLGFQYQLNKSWSFGAALEYSILSIVPNTNSYPIYFIRRGVYHNLFNFNINYHLN